MTTNISGTLTINGVSMPFSGTLSPNAALLIVATAGFTIHPEITP